MTQDWTIFHGEQEPHDGIDRLRDIAPPQWRQFVNQTTSVNAKKDKSYWTELHKLAKTKLRDIERGKSFRVPPIQSEGDKEETDSSAIPNIIDAVNAAIYLRRPLLVTGKPG